MQESCAYFCQSSAIIELIYYVQERLYPAIARYVSSYSAPQGSGNLCIVRCPLSFAALLGPNCHDKPKIKHSVASSINRLRFTRPWLERSCSDATIPNLMVVAAVKLNKFTIHLPAICIYLASECVRLNSQVYNVEK